MLTERQFWDMMEGEAIKPLLAGNDIGCFTTEQYTASRERLLERWTGGPRPAGCAIDLKMTRAQLSALAPVVVEVRPDVWALGSSIDLDDQDFEED